MRLDKALITLTALLALSAFTWPLYAGDAAVTEHGLAQTTFMLLMPILLALVVAEVSRGGQGSRQIAVLAVLAAFAALARMLGAGVAGIETMFFILVIGAYVFGSSFGFLLGTASMLVSAFITGGIGPWLPFQAMAAGLVGLVAGLLPRTRNPRWLLIAYAVPAAFAYGALMTLWNWPFMAGTDTSIGYLPGAGPLANMLQFLKYEALTGGLLWDTGRAITTALLIWLTAPALINTLSRAAIRAGFESN